MREIRIKNKTAEYITAENMLHLVKSFEVCEILISKKLVKDKPQLSFITEYGPKEVITIIRLVPFCEEYSRIEAITINGKVRYGYSPFTGGGEKIVIEA